jgi:ubiquinone/menaquinone biosynthesis C-methylase UbiE
MRWVERILMRAFGRPTGVLGRLGGMIMARTNQRMAQRTLELLDVQPGDKVLEIGCGPGVGIQLLASSASSVCHCITDLLSSDINSPHVMKQKKGCIHATRHRSKS